jgi:hypothetical protein
VKFQAFFTSFAEPVFFTGKKFIEACLLVRMGQAEINMASLGGKVIKTQYIPVALC